MGKVNYQKRWVGQELDDDAVRKKFIRHLKRWHNEFTTPYWKSNFNDWLIYECTVHHCGLHVKSIDEEVVTLCAYCVGIQTEGICLNVTFKVPTKLFKISDLAMMIGPYRYHKNGPATRFEWYPKLDDTRINPVYITEMAWWYDESKDETVKCDVPLEEE